MAAAFCFTEVGQSECVCVCVRVYNHIHPVQWCISLPGCVFSPYFKQTQSPISPWSAATKGNNHQPLDPKTHSLGFINTNTESCTAVEYKTTPYELVVTVTEVSSAATTKDPQAAHSTRAWLRATVCSITWEERCVETPSSPPVVYHQPRWKSPPSDAPFLWYGYMYIFIPSGNINVLCEIQHCESGWNTTIQWTLYKLFIVTRFWLCLVFFFGAFMWWTLFN